MKAPRTSNGQKSRIRQMLATCKHWRRYRYSQVQRPLRTWDDQFRRKEFKWRPDNCATIFRPSWRLLRHGQAKPRVFKSWALPLKPRHTVPANKRGLDRCLDGAPLSAADCLQSRYLCRIEFLIKFPFLSLSNAHNIKSSNQRARTLSPDVWLSRSLREASNEEGRNVKFQGWSATVFRRIRDASEAHSPIWHCALKAAHRTQTTKQLSIQQYGGEALRN
jgi:hypothetical protein